MHLTKDVVDLVRATPASKKDALLADVLVILFDVPDETNEGGDRVLDPTTDNDASELSDLVDAVRACFFPKPRTRMTDEDFDAFLDDATYAVRDMWEARNGDTIGEFEMDALNDAISLFFTAKRGADAVVGGK